MRIAIAVSSLSRVQPTWTTAIIAQELISAGFELLIVESRNFEVEPSGRLVARGISFGGTASPNGAESVTPKSIAMSMSSPSTKRCFIQMNTLDALILRCNPIEHGLLAFAQLVAMSGVVVANDPRHLSLVTHKAFLSTLSDVPTPRGLISRDAQACYNFYRGQEYGVVVKPARGSGGVGVSFVPAGNMGEMERAIDSVRGIGDGYAVVQEYLKAAAYGEKRLFFIGGRLVGGYLRERASGEFRHNLKQGGAPLSCELDDLDKQIGDKLGAHLIRVGAWLAGVDVIGGHVIEVNTLNPGGLHHINDKTVGGVKFELAESIERWVANRKS